MNWNELETKTKKIFVKVLKVSEPDINLGTNLNNDLAADYGHWVEIVMSIEFEFKVSLNDNSFVIWDDTFESKLDKTWGGAFGDKALFRQHTFEDFIWNLGYTINFQNNSNAIESDFISINVDKNGKFKTQLNSTKTEFNNVSRNTLNPAGFYLPIHNKWNIIVKELEDLINSPNLREYDLHFFLEKYPEILKENNYDTIIPEATITTNDNHYWSADFLLKPLSQFDFCKIIELKKPLLKTYLRNINRHNTFSSQLYAAINQIKDYSDAFNNEETREIFKKKYNFEVYKPDLHLIIGRKWDVTDTKIILDFKRRHNLEIDTWDDFLSKIKNKYT